jgi:hypothetical protein
MLGDSNVKPMLPVKDLGWPRSSTRRSWGSGEWAERPARAFMPARRSPYSPPRALGSSVPSK